ncbi:hypothetical protein [Azospirillum halopraeferens]|uniref:hypothetical protein n=1 Tax=Azospirillum halopraeferens TaxID=34010 RepID=UPI000404B4D7|nr:hypothetical protein [Azospirillum halopraeferens]
MPGTPHHPRSCRPRRLPGFAMAAALSLLVTACDERSDSGTAAEVAPQRPAAALAGKRWLDPGDRTLPEQWMASRLAGVDRPPDDPAVGRLHDLLVRADRAYDETPRMIANRAFQLQEMLAEKGIAESADSVVEGLLSVAGGDGITHGFGEAGQHYVTLRATGLDRDTALAALRRAAGDGRP